MKGKGKEVEGGCPGLPKDVVVESMQETPHYARPANMELPQQSGTPAVDGAGGGRPVDIDSPVTLDRALGS